MGAWAETYTWTSGVDFDSSDTDGNCTYGWFSIVSPFNGTLSSLRLQMGTGHSDSKDTYLALSTDLKSATTGFTVSDFVAISTNTCGTSNWDVTMNFSNAELAGGMTYYCYFLQTEEGGTYKTVSNRIFVKTGQTANVMHMNNIGQTSTAQTQWIIPVECTMTLNTNSYYRIKSNFIEGYVYSNSSSENKLCANTTTPSVTSSRHVWKISDGIKVQNVGSTRYIKKFEYDTKKGGQIELLAESESDAETFTIGSRVAKGNMGFVCLKSQTQADLSKDSWLNKYSSGGSDDGYVGCHNAVHDGDVFLFQKVKVITFSTAVAVNGGDAVTTIYVASDGSDAGKVTLSGSYKYSFDGGTNYVDPTTAASTITAAGTSDITVTVAALTANYKLMYNSQQVGSRSNVPVTFGAATPIPDFNMAFTTYEANPATYNDITSDVEVSATWNNSALQFTTGNPSSISKWYRVRMHSELTRYMYYNSGVTNGFSFLSDAKPSLSNENYLWGFVGNPFDGFAVYNKAAGVTVALDNANPCTMSTDGKSVAFKVKEGKVGTKGNTADTYFILYDVANSSNLNYRSDGTIQRWTGNDTGSTFMINAVKKVDFVDGEDAAFAVAVNGGSEVSTIWVATDGSDSFTLPTNYKYTIGETTYYGANAAAAIAAAGTSDLKVTVTSAVITDLANLSNSKGYVITNARGTWQFADDATSMSVASTTYEPTDEAQQIAIISRNSNYYLFSVNAGAYLTGSNTLTTRPTDNEQVEIVATSNTSYPWFFRFKNLKNGSDQYTNNINISDGIIKIDGWGPNGSNTNGEIDEGNSNVIIEAVDFNATAALAMFTEVSVTYHLQWSDGTDLSGKVADVVVSDARQSGNPAESLPATFESPFVTFSYSPTTIPASGTVTVTASWNGPFEISDSYADAKWYTVGIHSYYESNNYVWTYNGTDNVIPEAVATDNYSGVTNARLFCFIGDPYNGFKIYNKAAGSSSMLRKNGENVQVTMSSSDDNNLYVIRQSRTKNLADGYFCFKPTGNNYYLNFDKPNTKLGGWNDNDQGSTCWIIAPGQYYLDFIDGLILDAPVGAVGTRTYFQTVANAATIKNNIRGYRTNVAANMNSSELSELNSYLNPVAETSVIELGAGYWRMENAYTSFATMPAIYYDSSADKLMWSTSALTSADYQVNNIIKLANGSASGKYTMYSPNAQKYLSSTTTGRSEEIGNTMGNSGTDVTFTLLSDAQYVIAVGSSNYAVHANNHKDGAGPSGTLVGWNVGGGTDVTIADNKNSPSAWYIVQVNDIDITLNAGGDGNYYATICLPFDVTISEDATAYTLAQSGEWLVPTEVPSNQVPAGTPVLLKGTTSASASATINTGDAFNDGTALSCALTGTYVATTVDTRAAASPDKNYVLGKNSSNVVGFYHVNNNAFPLKANRAYLHISGENEARGYSLKFDDDVTGISSMDVGQWTMYNGSAIYNISGQRLNKMQKGINIVNGKKVLF
ncbi:MAG: hypothetical protein J5630_03665 [Bacteroidaceae bacterium]|nr:hypothetical protein [Bacteroidaceae bacterium]